MTSLPMLSSIAALAALGSPTPTPYSVEERGINRYSQSMQKRIHKRRQRNAVAKASRKRNRH